MYEITRKKKKLRKLRQNKNFNYTPKYPGQIKTESSKRLLLVNLYIGENVMDDTIYQRP